MAIGRMADSLMNVSVCSVTLAWSETTVQNLEWNFVMIRRIMELLRIYMPRIF